MADTDKLPVYNKARQLFDQLERSTQKVPTNIKRGSVAMIEEMIIGVMDNIAFANMSEKDKRTRLAFIQSAIETMQKVKIRVRTLHDLHFITKKGFDAIILAEENVVRQLAGWEKKTYSEVV